MSNDEQQDVEADQWVEVPEAARRFGIGAREVYERVDRGELDARKVAGRVEVRIPT